MIENSPDTSTASPPPDDTRERPRSLPSVALSGLFLLAVFYTLYFARLFILPLVLAILLNLLLAPLVKGLSKLHVTPSLGAAAVILFLVGILGAGAYLLAGPAAEWIDRAPTSIVRMEEKLRILQRPVEQVQRAKKEVEKLTQLGGEKENEAPVRVRGEGMVEAVLGGAWTVVGAILMMLVLLYFLLASGDLFLRKLIRVLPTLADKKRAVEIARKLQEDISTYLLTITLINIGLGLSIGICMHLVGMPNAPLWGVMAAILNFIPYLGAMLGVAVVAIAALFTFDVLRDILHPPLIYLLLTTTEAYLITPLVIGRRLTLNPVVILLGLLFWGWMWGIIGAVLAVPLLVSFKIFCDHVPPLAPLGEFLGR